MARGWTSAAAERLTRAVGEANISLAVEKIGDELLSEISCPPADLALVAQRLGVLHLVEEDLPISGELRKDGDSLVVVYSKHQSPERQRFTIAHELGHAVIQNTGRQAPIIGRELEALCNKIGAEILMPHKWMQEHKPLTFSPSALLGLSRKFKVSVSAMAIRCDQLWGTKFCETNIERIVWSTGYLTKGPIARYPEFDHSLRASASGRDIVPFRSASFDGWVRMEWLQLSKSPRKLICLDGRRTRPPVDECARFIWD